MTETIRFLRGASAPVRGVLLTCGDHLGTLAAARDLGRMGVHVLLADADADSLTARSRYVDRQFTVPGLDRPREWLAALLEFGRREPGHVLLPTSDDVCWLLDAHRARLEPWFHGEYIVVLKNGTKLTLSRSYRDKLDQLMGRQ